MERNFRITHYIYPLSHTILGDRWPCPNSKLPWPLNIKIIQSKTDQYLLYAYHTYLAIPAIYWLLFMLICINFFANLSYVILLVQLKQLCMGGGGMLHAGEMHGHHYNIITVESRNYAPFCACPELQTQCVTRSKPTN